MKHNIPTQTKVEIMLALPNKYLRLAVLVSMSVGMASTCMLAKNSEAAATVHRTSTPIKDASGRVEVILDFDFDPDKDAESDDVISDSQHYSTRCQHAPRQSCVVGGSYTGNGQSGTQGWAFLSGTSMAAPHVAGAAAYLADALALTTPASIEQAVRARFYPTGYADQGNNAVKIVQAP